MPPLEAEGQDTSKFVAFYIHDPAMVESTRNNNLFLPNSTSASEKRVCLSIAQDLRRELAACNPYVQDFLQICNIPDPELPEASFVISEKVRPKDAGSRTYTSHNLSEVCAMMPEAVGSRDIIVHRKGGGVKEFKDTNRAADPLHFVLLHPTGANGWSPDQLIESTEGSYESKRLTCNKYFKYLLIN